MAFKLDDQLLEELGLAALPSHEKQAILRQILETLEMRVGTTLASRMSDAQLDEFERLMPAEGDDQTVVQQKEQQALRWLETNFPNYKQVVNDELEKLKVEIRQSAPQILATSQQNNLPNPSPTVTQMPPMPIQQPSQMAAQPFNYGQAPVTPQYVPSPQQDMQMPLPPQPGFSPPTQYPTQPPTNPTTMQPPQPYMPPPSGNSQPPYPPQQQPY
jgi:hypothetical protein